MELRRAVIRIVSNYLRLLATLILGLYLVPLLLAGVGNEGYGLVALLVSTVGIVAVIEEAASWSMIRELGAAYHSNDSNAFMRIFNSALLVCVVAALIVLLIFAGILAALPLMEIAPELLPAARWFVVAKAIETATLVLLTPQFNLYLIMERMATYNFWLVARRASAVIAALIVLWINPAHDPVRGLIIFGWLSAALMMTTMVVAALIMTLQDRRLIPRLASASRDGIRALLGISGWNISIQAAQTLAFPAGAIIMNLAFGLIGGNMVFGFAAQLGAYARMIASGMTYGLDAVATRMTAGASGLVGREVHQLVRYSTMLHGVSAFPALVILGTLAHPLLTVWVGSKVQDPQAIDHAAVLVRILLIAFGIMVLCDCWTRILFGAGFVRQYAPVVIMGNVCTPVIAVVLLLVLPSSVRYTAVAWAITAIYVVFYLCFIPQKTARLLQMHYRDVFGPLLRPLASAIVCSPILLAFLWTVPHWNLFWLAVAVGAYGCAFGLTAWMWVLAPSERARLTATLPFRRAVRGDLAS